jgi:Methyl-accepting chemotaxis protein (MCP) signaling domain.
MIRSVLVGGGKGGYNILKHFKDSEVMSVISVIDVNDDAPGMKFAKEIGINTSNDIGSVLEFNPDLIIEVTGNEDVLERLRALAGNIRVMDSAMARIMMSVIEKLDMQVENLKTQGEVIASNIRSLFQEIERINTVTNAIFECMEMTGKNVEKIDSLVESIKRITKETKILGINASIEAARAGEYGRGFGVVANEIQNLTRDTDRSYGNIIDTIDNIKSQLVSMSNEINELKEISNRQEKASGSVSNALNELLKNIS